jgi:hypothetical protein
MVLMRGATAIQAKKRTMITIDYNVILIGGENLNENRCVSQ